MIERGKYFIRMLTKRVPSLDVRIVDFGCGQYPLPLGLDDCGAQCQYTGIDTQIDFINKANEKYRNDKRFEFIWLDIQSNSYNPKGKIHPNRFTVPCSTTTADILFCNSFFTHSGTEKTLRVQLKEAARILKGDGFMYATFFVSPPGTKSYTTTKTVYDRVFLFKEVQKYFHITEEREGSAEKQTKLFCRRK